MKGLLAKTSQTGYPLLFSAQRQIEGRAGRLKAEVSGVDKASLSARPWAEVWSAFSDLE